MKKFISTLAAIALTVVVFTSCAGSKPPAEQTGFSNMSDYMKGSLIDSRDGKSYKILKLNDQTWMAENLNYNADGSKCNKDQESNCQVYGRLYNWSTAMSACPDGWHLPSDEEWQVLVDLAGGDKIAGIMLKAASGWNKKGNGADIVGFSTLPGGYGSSDFFIGVGDFGNWWSSSATEDNSDFAYRRHMTYAGEHVLRSRNLKSELLSVRCLLD